MGKYDSNRDEILDSLSMEGWAFAQTGESDAPTGHVSALSIGADDLGPAYLDKIKNIDGVTADQIIGHFLVTENSDGFVTVTKYDTHEAALAAFAEVQQSYVDWLDPDAS